MNKIGNIKSRLLSKLTESYSKSDKSDMKDIIKLIRSNKEFTELYLFYEEIEKKYFSDKVIAEQFIEKIIPILKQKSEKVSSICKILDKKIGNISESYIPIYNDLDDLLEEDTLSNIDKKLIAKKNLFEYITTEKDGLVEESRTLVQNENLYYAILANNFNVLYENELTDAEKRELKDYMSLSDKEINAKIESLKEYIVGKVDNILNDDTDISLQEKLLSVKSEVERITPSKYNLYKLIKLKEGII